MIKNKKILALLIIGILVYLNALFNSFVWDDEEQVVNNALVHNLTNIPAFFTGSTFNSAGTDKLTGLYYKPLQTVSFSLLYTFFGPTPFFFHLFQLLFHLANGVLIFLLFYYFFRRKLFSFIAALIFLIHPINTEAVVYIAGLQEVLFFFFGMLAFYLFITRKSTLLLSFLTSLLLLLSLLSKETAVVILAITGLYFVLYQKEKLKHFSLGAILALFAYSLLRFLVAGIFFNKHGLTAISTMPFIDRLINIPKIIYFYLQAYLWPQNLAISQQWTVKGINFPDFYFPLVLDLLFFGVLIFFAIKLFRQDKEKFRLYLFFFLWFILALGFHLQIFPLDLTVSDRWFYLPQVGLLGMMGAITMTQPRNKTIAKTIKMVAVIIIILLATRTLVRTFDWRNGLTLYSHDEKLSQDAFDLENNLGVELFRIGQIDQAKSRFEKSIKLSPQWWTSYNNLGAYYENKNNLEKAAELYKISIKNGQYYLAYENLAFVLLKEKKYQEAINFCEKSLQILPFNTKLTMAAALAYYQNGNREKAVNYAKRLYELSPDTQSTQLLNAIINKESIK